MLGRGKQACTWACLNHLASAHHGYTAGHLAHYGQVVGDEQHRQPMPLLQPIKQIEHLRLDGNIQGSRWLVGYE
jgi:hypothetical protein